MSGKLLNFFYLYFVLLLLIQNTQSIQQFNTTTCDPSINPAPDANFVQGDEIIDGVNYGKLQAVASQFLLPRLNNLTIYAITFMENKCPQGYQLPTRSILTDLVSDSTFGANLIKLGAKVGDVILTSEKSFTTIDPTLLNAYVFWGTVVSATARMTVTAQNTIYVKPKAFNICVARSGVIISTSDYDYQTGYNYSERILSSPIQNAIWLMDGGKYRSEGLVANLPFDMDGAHPIQVIALSINGKKICASGLVYSIDYSTTDPNKANVTSIKSSDIKIQSLKLQAANENFTWFNRGNASIASKPTGGYYLFYTTDSYMGVVLEFAPNHTLINTFQVGQNKYILDIVATNFGFIIYTKIYKNNDKSILEGYNSDGTIRWSRIIMANRTPDLSPNVPPSVVVNQITFYNNKNMPLNGNQLCFANQGGKLSLGRGRVALFKANYNYFGNYSDGSRSDHTGDSLLTFDLDGNNENYSWTWSASHSLQQSIIYDGKHFVTASLGEPFPENIRVCFTYVNEYTGSMDGVRQAYVNHKSKCFDDLIPGKIPADGVGISCGFSGGIDKIGDTYVIAYARKACEVTSYTGVGKSVDYTNDFGVSTFKYDSVKMEYTDKKNYNLGDANLVKGIRISNISNKILLLLTVNDQPTTYLAPPVFVTTRSDRTEYMLIDTNGQVLTPRTSFTTEHVVPVSDDIRTLRDGTTIWGFINKSTNELKIAYISPPTSSGTSFLRSS